MRSLLLISVLALGFGVVACGEKNAAPANGADSIFTTPIKADTSRPAPAVDSNGLVVDSSQMRPAAEEAALHRFSPKQILHVYEAFRPLRKRGGVSQTEIDSFCKADSVTPNELRAILAEGDRLGWANAR